MKWLIPVLFVAGCTDAITLPQPVAYTNSCPDWDWQCQRNLDAQTLHYIGESDAAVMLMCADPELAPYIESCGVTGVY